VQHNQQTMVRYNRTN